MLTKDFILAGDAIFTVTCADLVGHVGHQTYRVRRVEFAKLEEPVRIYYFAYLLTGPDNTSDYSSSDYSYICRVDEKTGELRATAKSRAHADKTRVWKVLEGALRLIWYELDAEGIEIAHAGKCGRCGRLLTDPESIEAGIGPVCRGRLGASLAEAGGDL